MFVCEFRVGSSMSIGDSEFRISLSSTVFVTLMLTRVAAEITRGVCFSLGWISLAILTLRGIRIS